MTAIIQALASAFLVIALGALMNRGGRMSREMWAGIEHLAYYVLFPALVITSLGRADLSNAPVVGLVVVFVAAMALQCAVVFALRPVLMGPLGLSGPKYSSVFQGVIRWHTFIAIAIVASAYGEEGVALVSIAMATIIPIANVLSISVITSHSGAGVPPPLKFLKILFTNPFVLASIAGIIVNLGDIPLVEPIGTMLTILGGGATGVGLIVVGAGLRFDTLREAGGGVAVAVFLKLILLPAFAVGVAMWWGLTGTPLAVALVATSVPAATGGYILARQLGGDAEYFATILTMQIIVAVVTLPAILWLATG